VSLRSSVIYANNLGSMPTQVLTQTVHIASVQGLNVSATAPAFLQFFDVATSTQVVVGTTLPTWVVYTSNMNVSGPNSWPASGITFSSGVSISSTLTPLGTVETRAHARLVVDG
jgi:hypothetical protein